MTAKPAIFASVVSIVFYTLVLCFIDPLADLATNISRKTGIPFQDLESKRFDFVFGVSYISLILVLFILLDVLSRNKKHVSLIRFLFAGCLERRREPEYLFRLTVFVCTFVVVPLLAFAFLQPTNILFWRPRPLDAPFFAKLFVEDGPMEWATFISFAIAGILLLRIPSIMSKAGGRKPFWIPWFLYGLAAGVLFVAFEEISWGQRVFGWDTPEMIAAYNTQGETNLHNMGLPTGLSVSKLDLRLYAVIGIVLFLVSWCSCLFDVLGKVGGLKLLPHSALVFLAAEISIFSLQNFTNELVEEIAAIYILLLAWQFLLKSKIAAAPRRRAGSKTG